MPMKVHTRQLDEEHRADALRMLVTTTRETFTVLHATCEVFRTAAWLADAHGSLLRAGDALRLRIVANRGARLLSLDRVQVKAARDAGMSARLI